MKASVAKVVRKGLSLVLSASLALAMAVTGAPAVHAKAATGTLLRMQRH